jgi:hypothetical protein
MIEDDAFDVEAFTVASDISELVPLVVTIFSPPHVSKPLSLDIFVPPINTDEDETNNSLQGLASVPSV